MNTSSGGAWLMSRLHMSTWLGRLLGASLGRSLSLWFALLLVILVAATPAAAAPDCGDLQGRWKSELGSTLVVKKLNKDGYLSGYFVSPVENGAEQFKAFGWVNKTSATSSLHYMPAVTFSVSWGEYGSVSSWSGGCIVKDDIPTLVMMMHLSLVNAQYQWDHLISNSDRFVPE